MKTTSPGWDSILRFLCSVAVITSAGSGSISVRSMAQATRLAGASRHGAVQRTASPARMIPADYCAKCHRIEFDEWGQSLHANAARTPFYRTSAQLLNQAEGVAALTHCDSCHNPIAAQHGTSIDVSPGGQVDNGNGVTCVACHSIVRVKSTSGDGSYAMGIPAVMVDSKGNRIPGEVPYREILAHPGRHRQAVMQDFYRTSEFCAVCHNATVEKSLNGYKPMREFATYDEWQASAFSHQDPLNFYPERLATCQDCHMPSDLSARSHRWIAGNTAVPFYYRYKDQLEKTIKFLQSGHILNVDIMGIEKAGTGRLIAPLGSVPLRLQPKDDLIAFVVIQNNGIGHSLLPELRDLYEAWVDFRVTDGTGKEVFHSGFLNPDGSLDKYAHIFLNRPLDENGDAIENHQIWRMRSTGFDSTIASGGAALVRYEFRLPQAAVGPIRIIAQVKYRHFQQRYLNTVLGPHHPVYPIVVLASQTRTLMIGENRPGLQIQDENPDWMRWNNLGIACLGPPGGSGFAPVPPAEYAQALDAFSKVVKLRAGYPDGYTNIALTRMQLAEYDVAGTFLQKALSLSPNNARALYYMALVEQHRGHAGQETVDLERVVRQYPQSRDARRELGAAYLAEHRYDEALKQFQALQQIDPDDLTAHFNLAILYRKMGMSAEADEQERAYEAEKPDPATPTYSFEFLREHPGILNESLPWHVHTDMPADGTRPSGAEDSGPQP